MCAIEFLVELHQSIGKILKSNQLPAPKGLRSQRHRRPFALALGCDARCDAGTGGTGYNYRWGQKITGDHGVMDESSFACWNVDVCIGCLGKVPTSEQRLWENDTFYALWSLLLFAKRAMVFACCCHHPMPIWSMVDTSQKPTNMAFLATGSTENHQTRWWCCVIGYSFETWMMIFVSFESRVNRTWCCTGKCWQSLQCYLWGPYHAPYCPYGDWNDVSAPLATPTLIYFIIYIYVYVYIYIYICPISKSNRSGLSAGRGTNGFALVQGTSDELDGNFMTWRMPRRDWCGWPHGDGWTNGCRWGEDCNRKNHWRIVFHYVNRVPNALTAAANTFNHVNSCNMRMAVDRASDHKLGSVTTLAADPECVAWQTLLQWKKLNPKNSELSGTFLIHCASMAAWQNESVEGTKTRAISKWSDLGKPSRIFQDRFRPSFLVKLAARNYHGWCPNSIPWQVSESVR